MYVHIYIYIYVYTQNNTLHIIDTRKSSYTIDCPEGGVVDPLHLGESNVS